MDEFSETDCDVGREVSGEGQKPFQIRGVRFLDVGAEAERVLQRMEPLEHG